jgi:hypothetical protein
MARPPSLIRPAPGTPPRPRPLPRVPPLALIKVFLLAAAAVGGSAWAVLHYYARAREPIPAPAATEIPAPPLEPAN